MPFEHEKLPVYHLSLRVAGDPESLARMLPATRRDIQDQLRRASVTVVLNIAEGAGEFSPAEKARIYRIARRSAAETAAAIDAIGAIVSPTPPLVAKIKEELEKVHDGLDKLIFSQRRR